MATSIKKNFIYNTLNTVTQLLFPLLTFPYASRIMLADGIGQVNFFTSIISYITLFTSIGIPLYAIRESARVRENPQALSRISMEIILLHASLTLLGYLAVFILCLFVPEIKADIPLFLLLSLSVLLNAIGCNWLFQAVEDFKYITIRGLIVKFVAVILLFLFVKTREDLLWYALYTVIGSVGGNVFNLFRMRRYVRLSLFCWSELHPLRHLKPSLKIFVLNLIISIYINLDSIMLGFISGATSVGYYTGATKITSILVSVVSSLGAVMLPRLSNLVQKGDNEGFNRLSQKSVDFTMTFATPMFVGLMILAPSLIRLFCGPSYAPSILTLEIISPIILIIGLSGVMGIQVLYPQGRENLVILSTAIGAGVNFMLNCFLIPLYAQNGAAIATLFAESSVTLTMIWIGAKYLPFKLFTRHNLYIVLATCVMAVPCVIFRATLQNDFLILLLSVLTGAIIYGILMYCMRNVFVMQVLDILVTRLQKGK